MTTSFSPALTSCTTPRTWNSWRSVFVDAEDFAVVGFALEVEGVEDSREQAEVITSREIARRILKDIRIGKFTFLALAFVIFE